jgi:hypothetical protein
VQTAEEHNANLGKNLSAHRRRRRLIKVLSLRLATTCMGVCWSQAPQARNAGLGP